MVKKAKKKSSRVSTREALYKAAIGHFAKKGYSIIREMGLNRHYERNREVGHLRADLHCLKSDKTIHIVEIKSCSADLKSDSKLHLYVPFCHKMTIVCTKKTWLWAKKNYSLPPSVGVMILDADSGYLKSVRNSKTVNMDSKVLEEVIFRRAFKNGQYTRYNTRRYRVFLGEE